VERQAQQQRRIRRNRRRAVTLGVLAVVVVLVVVLLGSSGGSKTSATSTTTTTRTGGAKGAAAVVTSGPASIEAGVVPWQLPAPVSRPAVVTVGTGFAVLGGLAPSQASVATAYTVNPATGTSTPAGTLAAAVHDAAGVSLGSSTFVLGGGSPNTVATVQSIPTPAGAGATPPAGAAPVPAAAAGTVAGQLPAPRSDLAIATVGSGRHTTAYVVGGYTGTTYLPAVLATTDGTRYTSVADLTIPVRYPAVVAQGGLLYAFGGQTASTGSATTATDAIQVVDPASHRTSVVAHLPQPVYGASAFVINGTIYVAGGQVPAGRTLTEIYAFVPSSKKVLNAGLLPQAAPVHQQRRLADRPLAEKRRVLRLTLARPGDPRLEDGRLALAASQQRREDPAARSEWVRRSRL